MLRPEQARWVILYNHSLTKLPDALFELSQLEVLTIYAEKLRELPAGFARLRRLRRLGLSSCASLREIPDAVLGLEALRHVSIYQCDRMDKRFKRHPLVSWIGR